MPEETDVQGRMGDELGASLDAWGARERSVVMEPPAAFVRQVRAARTPRVMLRVIEGLAVAAVLALGAYVALRSDSMDPARHDQVVVPLPPEGTDAPARGGGDGRMMMAGAARRALDADDLGWMDEAERSRGPAAAPARAADAYCAGCIEELTRL